MRILEKFKEFQEYLRIQGNQGILENSEKFKEFRKSWGISGNLDKVGEFLKISESWRNSRNFEKVGEASGQTQNFFFSFKYKGSANDLRVRRVRLCQVRVGVVSGRVGLGLYMELDRVVGS